MICLRRLSEKKNEMAKHIPAALPPMCPDCRPFAGLWRRNVEGDLERCGCPRGRMLAAGKVKRLRGRAGNAAEVVSQPYCKTAPPVRYDGRMAATGEQ